MNKQFRDGHGQVLFLQTTQTHLAIKAPGANRLLLTPPEIDRLIAHLTEARHDLAQKPPSR